MVKISLTIVSALLVSGTVCATPLDYFRATTLSFTSDGPILHETPATPDLPPAADDRITLSDTGKNGWYIAPNFAINLLSDFNNANISVEYDNGYAYGISIGKEIQPGFRMQLDIAHIKNDLNSLFIQLGGGLVIDVADSHITQTPIIFNAIWEPRSHDRLSPFFGIGAGAIKGDYSVSQLPGILESLLDIGWAFAIQVRAGFSYELSNTSSFTAEYHFLHAHYASDLDLNNNLVQFGLEFRF